MTRATKVSVNTNILTLNKLKDLTYPLPESWKNAAGLLKGKKNDPVKYQRQIRKEWELRLKKLERQFCAHS